ncbi:hypothetical protein Vretifemale_19336, partial [Volvox reticuliferus]
GRSSISSVARMPPSPPRLRLEAPSETEAELYDLSPTSFAAAAAAEVAAVLRSSALFGRNDEQQLPAHSTAPPAHVPVPSTAAAAATAPIRHEMAAAAASPPILPWSRLNAHPLSSVDTELPPPPSSPPSPTPPMGEPTAAELAEVPANLPPLALAALRRRLMADEDDDVLGSGPQSCSPRAARTDSPLRAVHHRHYSIHSLIDSPVHSPKLLSQVY